LIEQQHCRTEAASKFPVEEGGGRGTAYSSKGYHAPGKEWNTGSSARQSVALPSAREPEREGAWNMCNPVVS